MPLWTLSIRSLACRHHRPHLRPTPPLLKTWRHTTHLYGRNSSTVWQQNRPDDVEATTSPSTISDPDDPKSPDVRPSPYNEDSFKSEEKHTPPEAPSRSSYRLVPHGALSTWRLEYAKIRISYGGKPQYNGRNGPKPPALDPRVFEWVDMINTQLDDCREIFSGTDLSLPTADAKEIVWTQAALWFLAYDRLKMPRFLLATHREAYVRLAYLRGSIWQLASHIHHSDAPNKASHMRNLVEAAGTLVNREGNEPLGLYNPFIRIMVQLCPDDQIMRFYHTIKECGVQLSAHCYLHLVKYFAENGHYKESLESLEQAKAVGDLPVNGYAFRSSCSTVLRNSILRPEGLRETLRIVNGIVDMGVELDNPICDIIMLNAVEAGDLKTAFDVYHSLMERGLRPTESTFSALLKGCSMNFDDAEMLNDVIRDAIDNNAVRRSELVSTQILHCLALHHAKHNPETAFATLADACAQLFDLEPLRRLGLPLPAVSQSPASETELLPPTPHAIAFMVGASINNTLLRNPNPAQILPLYTRWRELVEAGDPDFSKTATTAHLPNIFLMAFIRSPSSLMHAARVVRDMQRLPSIAGVFHCKPVVQTWSIFLHGFTRHGKLDLAEQVLTHMRSKGIEPDVVTWNTLITGYTRARDVEGTVDAIRRADAAGWEEWEHGGMEFLRRRNRLKDVLREERLTRRLDFSDELKLDLGKRLGDVRIADSVEGEEGEVLRALKSGEYIE